MATLTTGVSAHILHNTQQRYGYLAEHLNTLAGIQQGNVLGRGDDHGTRQRDVLGHGQLNITGAWRHIHHQHIHCLPFGLGQQLLQGAAGHWPAPDRRGSVRGDKTHGHTLQAVGNNRLQQVIGDIGLGTLRHAHHQPLTGTVDIGIQQADAVALCGQGQGQVGGHCRLTNAALAGGHSDHPLDPGQLEFTYRRTLD